MRRFRRVVDPFVSAMLNARCEFRLGRRIGSERVGHQNLRLTPSLEELAHEKFRSCSTPLAQFLLGHSLVLRQLPNGHVVWC